MTGGARPSAAAAGGAHSWATLGCQRAGLRSGSGLWRPDGGKRGASAGLCLMGCAETRKKRKKVFPIFLKKQTNEFKHEFEFKHSKTMHQHVCNNKLLYFIILINKND
jgi:hypothetical protein